MGDFLVTAGLTSADLQGLQFPVRNRRLTAEAYQLMAAVNRRFARGDEARHGVARQPHDLDILATLPGRPFRLTGLDGSAVHRRLIEETRWCERQLGWQFPRREEDPTPAAPWGPETLAALERAVESIHSPEIRQCIAEVLLRESRRRESGAADTDAMSRAARRIAPN